LRAFWNKNLYFSLKTQQKLIKEHPFLLYFKHYLSFFASKIDKNQL